ncbi:MAG: hypothetical protein EPN65_15230 [Pandoraea sp.]|uniref:hypothetical protein n=1 Tax=Pandoraea sp. TaxID=1883445 RepID=UPI00121ADFD1|nr:hypothetical protein [Pandoraea sp.]TAM16079.1 MAG: hypothetical protein EPN65_15230 [Pandoraea sp.]
MPTTPEEQRALIKEALQEWLDAKYAEVGKWTLRGICAAALAALVLFMAAHGFKLEGLVMR